MGEAMRIFRPSTAVFGAVSVLAIHVVLASAAVADQVPLSPAEPICLFNGRDLEGFYTWQKETRREDPNQVYSVRDGVLRISGEGRGCLVTRQLFRDYHLIAEYKWGTRTDGAGGVRNSGILLHGTGPDGGFKNMWMTSIEVQLAQGCEGDFVVIRGNDRNGQLIPATITSRTVTGPDGRTRWSPDGTPTFKAAVLVVGP